MKFCEKLQKLRKEKGYSQEELADLLDVSRQSVSKWESGTTYPEMDKLLSLCKIFNVTLDDLTNDDVTGDAINEKSRSNFSNLVYTILDMINKSIEMFKSMNRREVAKCVAELIVVIFILLLFKLPFIYVNDSLFQIFANFSIKTCMVLNSIWLFISNIIYLVLFIAIFIYVYKSRFLDKYDFSAKKEIAKEETSEEEKTEKVKEVKTSSVGERHSFVIFDCLGAIFNVFIKICLFFIAIPLVITFAVLALLTVLALIIQFMKIHYIGIFVALLGATLVSYVFMDLSIKALFSAKINFKNIFIIFVGGLIISSVGGAITTMEVASTKYVDEIPAGIKLTEDEKIFEIDDNLTINAYLTDFDYNYYHYIDFSNYRNINFVEDETYTDTLKITTKYYEGYNDVFIRKYDDVIIVEDYNSINNVYNLWNLFKDNLKDKTVYDYEELLSHVDITVTTSHANIEKLEANYEECIKRAEEENERYNSYESVIEEYQEQLEDLQNVIENKDEEIEELESKIYELEEKLNNIQSQF